MFGIMKAGCGLPAAQREEWMGHICGLCLALRQQAGQVARLTTNYDAALLLALWQAQTTEQPTYNSLCPLRRQTRLTVAAPDSEGAQFAAALAVTMGGVRLADQVQDGDTAAARLPWLPSKIAHRWQKQGAAVAARVGFDTAVISQAAQEQTVVEATPGRDFLYYARPTELSVGAAFGHTAVLARQPHNQSLLIEMGRLYGRLMFLIDSYQDYAADLAQDYFNALAAALPHAEPTLYARHLFQQSHTALVDLLAEVVWQQPLLIRQLLVDQLGRIGSRLFTPTAADRCALPTVLATSTHKKEKESQRFCGAFCDGCFICGECSECCCGCCDCCDTLKECDCCSCDDCDCCGCDGCDCG
jgi:hypothetical protein